MSGRSQPATRRYGAPVSTSHDRALGWFTWMTTPWRALAMAYVVLEGVLGAIAFSSRPDGMGPSGIELTALALLLPTLVMALPVFYVVGAGAWDVAGQSQWPVTLTFTVLFVGAATVNVTVLTLFARGVARRRLSG